MGSSALKPPPGFELEPQPPEGFELEPPDGFADEPQYAGPIDAADFRARMIDRPKHTVNLQQQTGLPFADVVAIQRDLEGDLPDVPEKERMTISADVAKALRETPQDLYIGTVRVGANVLSAIKRQAMLFSGVGMEGTANPYEAVKPQWTTTGDKAGPRGGIVTRAAQRQKGAASEPLMETPMLPGAIAGQAFGVVSRLPDVGQMLANSYASRMAEAQDSVTIRNAPVTKLVRSVVQGGIPSVFASAAVSVLTGDPLIGLAVLAETSAGQSFEELTAAGMSPMKAQFYAELDGAAEAAGEALVFPKFVKGLTNGIPLSNAILLFAENATQEGWTGFNQAFTRTYGLERMKGTGIMEAAGIAFGDGVDAILENALVGGLTSVPMAAATLPATIYNKVKMPTIEEAVAVAQEAQDASEADQPAVSDEGVPAAPGGTPAAEAAEAAPGVGPVPEAAPVIDESSTTAEAVSVEQAAPAGTPTGKQSLQVQRETVIGPEPSDVGGQPQAGPAQPDAAAWGASNKGVTREEYDAIKKRRSEASGRLVGGRQAGGTILFDPQEWSDMVKIGMFHVEAGARAFGEWSRVMLNDVGQSIKPHLQDLWQEVAPQAEGMYDVKRNVVPKKIGKATVNVPKYVVVEKATGKEVEAFKDQKEAWAKVDELEAKGKAISAPRTRPAIFDEGEPKMVSEQKALSAVLRKAAREAENAYRVGKAAGVEQATAKGEQKLASVEAKRDAAEEIRKELLGWIRENVPGDLQAKVYPALAGISATSQPETNLKRLLKAIERAENAIMGQERRQAIGRFKETWSAVKAKLKTMDNATKARFADIMGDVDLAKMSEDKKSDLASLSKYMNRLADAVAQGQMEQDQAQEAVMKIPRARREALQRLAKTPLAEMTTEDIKRLGDELQSLLHQYDLKNKLAGKRKKQERSAALKNTISEVTQAPGTEAPTTETGIFRQGLLSRFFTSESAHIDTLVERITRPGDTTSTDILVRDIWEGWRKRAEVKRQTDMALQRGMRAIGFTIDDFDAMSDTVDVQIGGTTQKVSRWDLLSLYMHSKSESNVQEILKSKGLAINGVTVDTFGSYVEMMDAIAKLSAKEQAVGDLWTDVNANVLAPAINAASMELEGRELADDPTYWRRGRVFPKSVAGRIADVAIEDTGPFQPRTGGTAPIEIVPFHVAATQARDAAATYGGMAVPLFNARSIVNTAEWQNAVERAGHADSMNSLFTLYRRMQSYGNETGVVDAMGKKLLTRFAASRLSLRISSMVGQFAGIPVAATEIPARYFVGVKPNRKLLQRLMELNAVLDARWNKHHMSIEAGNMALLAGYKGMFFGYQPLLDKPLNALARADGAVGSIMAGAISKQLQAERPDLAPGSLEFDTEVANRLEYATRRTQGSGEIVDRSVVLSDTTLAARALGMFRTAMEAQWNVLLRAVNRYQKSAKTPADLAALGEDIGLVTTGAILESALKLTLRHGIKVSAIAALASLALTSPDDDDKDKDYVETAKSLGIRTGENILSVVPGGNWLGGLLRMTGQAIEGSTKWDREPMAGALDTMRDQTLTLIPDAVEMGRNMVTGATYQSGPNKGEPKWHRNAQGVVLKTLDVFSMATGAPFSGPVAEFRGPAGMLYDAARIQTMTDTELSEEIRRNTYRQRSEDGKHRPGDPHDGQEMYVNMLRTEQQKR